MNFNASSIHEKYPPLNPKPKRLDKYYTAYEIALPVLPSKRFLDWAELRVPVDFLTNGRASVYLPKNLVLRVPHVELNGRLCLNSDPGPFQYSPEDRIFFTLEVFEKQFLNKWINGDLDEHFTNEPLNYWEIFVLQSQQESCPVRRVLTIDVAPPKSLIREGLMIQPGGLVIVADGALPLRRRVIESLAPNTTQIKIRVADIPLETPPTPATWPTTSEELNVVLENYLGTKVLKKFNAPLRKRKEKPSHRFALFRHDGQQYAYLLAGGPPMQLNIPEKGIFKKRRAFISSNRPIPLEVSRLDAEWTAGRDQIPTVGKRQHQHVLVLGAGALGSPVINHLAKAGVGRITAVDPDTLNTANLARHELGADQLFNYKVEALAQQINKAYPSTCVEPIVKKAQFWVSNYGLDSVDMVLDLTGEPDVRWAIEQARIIKPCPILIGWMEPYVAAAHACTLPDDVLWYRNDKDCLEELQAVKWPNDVIKKEPGCSREFQSYTAAAADYAVAMIAENALDILDGKISMAKVMSWVRGKDYLDRNYEGLNLRNWAKKASSGLGMIIQREF